MMPIRNQIKLNVNN